MPDYIDNKLLHEELSAYAKTMRAAKREAEKKGIEHVPKQMSETLAEMLIRIPRHMARKSNFSGYPFLEDMIAEASMTIVNYVDNYDPCRYTNAVAYVSQISWQAMTKYIMREKKQLSAKIEYAKQNGSLISPNAQDWLEGYEETRAK